MRVVNAYKFSQNPLIQSGEYVSNKIKVALQHSKCNTSFETRPNNFQQGKSCPTCSNKKRLSNLGVAEKTYEEVVEEIDRQGKGNTHCSVSLIPVIKKKLKVCHLSCNTEYSVRFNDFQQGYRCPVCALKNNTSTAVYDMIAALDFVQADYVREVKFEECRHKLNLPFDFCIYINRDEDEYILIEYNGSQHYSTNAKSLWHSGDKCNSLPEIQLRDKIKVDFAKEFNIPLYVIKYTDNHLEELRKILKEHNIM